MPYITTHSGIDWHYDIEGTGEHLLFLHGWGVDKRIWRQQSKFFSQYYRAMTIDLPGHGKSGWKEMTLETMVKDLKTILQVLQLTEVTIIGSSLGGLMALKLYAIHSTGIKRLALVGAMPKFAKSADYPYGLDISRMRKLKGQLDSDYPSIVDIFFRSLFTREERQGRRFKWLQKFRRFDGVPMQQALAGYLDILEQEDLREVLKEVRVPIQFINGQDDEICNKEIVAFLKKVRPESQFYFFEQCGHFPFLSKPHEFNQVLGAFLKRSTL